MSRCRSIALTCAVAVIAPGLVACAARRAPATRGLTTYESASGRAPGPFKKVDKDGDGEPTTIAGWEARIQSHAAVLRAITSPPPPPPPVTVSPGTAPARRAPVTGGHRAPRRDPAATRQTIRCQRICKHVRSICYAADRICQIARRLGDDASRQACQRNRKRCKSARDVTSRTGCAGCGSASRRRRRSTRRACLARAPRRP